MEGPYGGIPGRAPRVYRLPDGNETPPRVGDSQDTVGESPCGQESGGGLRHKVSLLIRLW